MATFLFANNAQSTIASGITDTDTTVVLASGTGTLFPNPGAGEQFAMTFTDAATGLVQEIVYCTAKVVDTLTIARAQEGTTARAWLAGDLAAQLWTAGQAAAMSQSTSSSGILISTQVVNATGIPSYPAGTQTVEIELVGGGASGGGSAATGAGEGSAGGGGGAGAFIQAQFTISEVVGQTLQIGAGASPGAAGDPGNAGGETSLGGTILVAPGGQAGPAGSAQASTAITGGSTNSNPPSATLGLVVVQAPGASGTMAVVVSGTNLGSGYGGRSQYGPGGSNTSNANGSAGLAPGSGGSGGSALENGAATVGGQGADGQAIIRSYS